MASPIDAGGCRLGCDDGGHRGRKHGHGCSVGPDDQEPGRTEDRVGDRSNNACVDAGFRQQTGDRGIGDGARQAHRGDRQPGRNIAAGANLVETVANPATTEDCLSQLTNLSFVVGSSFPS